MKKISTVLFTGQAHTTVKRPAASATDHGLVDVRMTSTDGTGTTLEAVAPHPTAEQLFGGAWSACYTTAVGLVAQQMRVKLPADMAVDVEVDLGQNGAEWLLQARLNVRLPGLDEATADKLAHAAHEICPYSKATKGNIDVALNVFVS
jgi:Ohr subfamily peroxiredoxin